MRPTNLSSTHNYASPVLDAANVTDVHTERQTDPLQHIHADWFVARHFPIGALTDPRQADDVARTISTSFQEEPEAGISDHVYHLFVIQFPAAGDRK